MNSGMPRDTSVRITVPAIEILTSQMQSKIVKNHIATTGFFAMAVPLVPTTLQRRPDVVSKIIRRSCNVLYMRYEVLSLL